MRSLTIWLAVLPGLAFGQAWEKLVVPGVTYRMEVTQEPPRVVHALRFAQAAAALGPRTELAQGRVFAGSAETSGRATLSQTVQNTGALAAVNGDFFPWTGDPLGAMVRDGELVSRPYPGRSAFGWGPKSAKVARLGWSGSVTLLGDRKVALFGLNESCPDGKAVLFTPAGGRAKGPKAGTVVVFESDSTLTPDFTGALRVLTVLRDANEVPVGSGQMALMAIGAAAVPLADLMKGDEVTVTVKSSGFDWKQTRQVIGGGPALLQGGKYVDAWAQEGFKSEFGEKRHPRTAIGATKGGDVWLVVVDGRQDMSVGATVAETAAIMARLGCVEAMNLDGGGSSTLALSGLVLNRPSDGSERPIANSVLLMAGAPTPAPDAAKIVGADKLKVGGGADFQVADSQGRPLPGSVVFWSATGAAWIDQSGRLRGLRPGKAVVRAWVGGKVLEAQVEVEGPSGGR